MATGPRPGTRRQVLRLCMVAAIGVSVACDPVHPDDRDRAVGGRWTIAGGVPQGVYESWATAFSTSFGHDHPGARIDVRSTGGSRANLQLLMDDAVALALAAADSCADALRPARSEQRTRWSALARLYDDYMHLIVPAGSAIQELGQLRGRRLVCGAVGSGTTLIARRVLQAAGVSDVQLISGRLVEGLAQLATGRADAVFWSGGLPTAGVLQAWHRQALRLVPLDEVGTLLRERYSGIYRMAVIPAATYADSPPVSTFAVANLLLSRADLGDATVSAVLDTLFDDESAISRAVPAFAGFHAEMAIDTEPVPMNPSAVSYFRALKP